MTYLVTYYRAGSCAPCVVQVQARSKRAAKRWVRAEWLDVVAIAASRMGRKA